MKAKLIKKEYGYVLGVEDKLGTRLIAVNCQKQQEILDRLDVACEYKLSFKNCQAIERGYDLDELAEEFTKDESYGELSGDLYKGYIFGFQKCLKLMGDKKFSEEDVILIAEYIRVASKSTPNVRTKDLFDEYQSLQQNEWDVEIVMKNNRTGKIINSDFDLEWDEDGLCDRPIPKLDADGCLILKRI